LHRRGLDALTHALLENETLDGETAARLIDEAFGQPVWPNGTKTVSSLVLEPAVSAEATPAEATPSTEAPAWAPPTLPTN
jgi:hypothetical protein